MTIEKLLFKTVANKLSDGGKCPHDPHCIHTGFGSCLATSKTLKEMEVKLKEQVREESHSGGSYSIGGTTDDYDPDTVYKIVHLNVKKEDTWPCAEAEGYVLILPIDLKEEDDPDA